MTKNQRTLHEALDANLEPDDYKKLITDIEADSETSAAYRQLKSAEEMLREARPRTAPKNMALNIMAKIQQAEALPQEAQPAKSARALALGLGITALVSLPLLVVLSLITLAILGTGSALSGAALGVVGMAAFAYTGLSGLMSFAGQIFMQYPFLLAALLLIPLSAFGLWRLNKSSKAK